MTQALSSASTIAFLPPLRDSKASVSTPAEIVRIPIIVPKVSFSPINAPLVIATINGAAPRISG
ncbi:hypothetical protein D3C87_2197340 [compost metagenome]